MSNKKNYSNNNQGNSKTLFYSIGSIVLAAALFCGGVAAGWYGHIHKDKQVGDNGGIVTPDENGEGGGIVTVPDGEEEMSPLGLRARRMLRTEYEDYGIETHADTAFVITASYSDDSITYKELDWSWAWADGSTGKWGNGKTISTYATGSASSNTLTYTVTIHEAFGEQLIVSAKNRANPNVSQSATFDYARRVTGLSLALNGDGGTHTINTSAKTAFNNAVASSGSSDATMTVTPTFTYSSVYTVEDTFNLTALKVKTNPTFITEWKLYCNRTFGNGSLVNSAFIDMEYVGEKNVLTSCPDLTCWECISDSMFDGGTGESLKMWISSFYSASAANVNIPVFLFSATVTGEYSDYSFDYDATGGKLAFNYGATSFGTVASSGALNFNQTSWIV